MIWVRFFSKGMIKLCSTLFSHRSKTLPGGFDLPHSVKFCHHMSRFLQRRKALRSTNIQSVFVFASSSGVHSDPRVLELIKGTDASMAFSKYRKSKRTREALVSCGFEEREEKRLGLGILMFWICKGDLRPSV